MICSELFIYLKSNIIYDVYQTYKLVLPNIRKNQDEN